MWFARFAASAPQTRNSNVLASVPVLLDWRYAPIAPATLIHAVRVKAVVRAARPLSLMEAEREAGRPRRID